MQIQFPAIPATFGNTLPPSQAKWTTGEARSGPVAVYSEPAPQAGNPPDGIPDSADELLAMVYAQQAQLGAFFNSLGQGQSADIGSFASSGGGILPDFADPTGDAIDYLLASTGNGSRAGDIFNLALSANNQGLELAQVQGAVAARAQSAYQEAAALVQMVQNAKQSNLTTLFQLGGGGASAGINSLI